MTDTERMTIAEAREAFDAALKKAASEKAKLYRGDGTQRYADKTHDEEVALIGEPIGEALAALDAAVDRELATVERLLAARDADPLLAIKPGDLRDLAAIAPLVAEDFATLAPDDLARRIAGTLAAGGAVEFPALAAAHWRYGQRRLDAEQAAAAREGRTLLGDEGIAALAGAVRALAGSFPQQGRITEPEARTRRAAAVEAQRGARAAADAAFPPDPDAVLGKAAAAARYQF